jgi:hypothetical protein
MKHRKQIIEQLILPNAEAKEVLEYRDGIIDYDDDYVNEVYNNNKQTFTDDCIELLNQIDSEWCDKWDVVLDLFGEDIANKLDELIVKSQKL